MGLVRVLREDRTEAATGELGRMVIKLPLPPGNFSTLYRADERFKSAYFIEFPVRITLILQLRRS